MSVINLGNDEGLRQTARPIGAGQGHSAYFGGGAVMAARAGFTPPAAIARKLKRKGIAVVRQQLIETDKAGDELLRLQPNKNRGVRLAAVRQGSGMDTGMKMVQWDRTFKGRPYRTTPCPLQRPPDCPCSASAAVRVQGD